jgi:hypothetical protein
MLIPLLGDLRAFENLGIKEALPGICLGAEWCGIKFV